MHRTSCAFARRTRRSFIGATALALALAAPAGAEPLRLDDVVAIALRDNPAIANAGHRADALHARPAQVSAYDDPTFSWEAWDIPESLRVDAAENNIFRLSQKMPFPGKRTLAGEVAAHEADAAQRGRARDARSTSQAAVTARLRRSLAGAPERARIVDARQARSSSALAHTAEQQVRGRRGRASRRAARAGRADPRDHRGSARRSWRSTRRAPSSTRCSAARPTRRSASPRTPAMQPHRDVSLDDADRAARCGSAPSWPAQRAADRARARGVELAQLGWRPDFEVSVGRFINYGRNDGFGAMASVTAAVRATAASTTPRTGEARARLSGAEVGAARAARTRTPRGRAGLRRGQHRRARSTTWRAARTSRRPSRRCA